MIHPPGRGTVFALLGPTGVGKTAVAVRLAAGLGHPASRPPESGLPAPRLPDSGLRVISCDSMQVYRAFPVLTNQPTALERQSVRHELVGMVDPDRPFSAGEYAALARPLIEADLDEHGWALLVGGTGLYARAALGPLAMAPAADPVLRRALEARAAAEGPKTLYQELRRRDLAAAETIGPYNHRRLLRALEVIEITGAPWSGRSDLWDPAYYRPTLVVALTLEREELYRRIDLRTTEIVRGGAVEEVRRYLEERGACGGGAVAGVAAAPVGDLGRIGTESSAAGPPALARPPVGIESAIGFREILRYLQGLQTEEETVVQVAAATRRYARRQATWLRKLKDAVIIDVRDRDAEAVAAEILSLALSGEHTKEP